MLLPTVVLANGYCMTDEEMENMFVIQREAVEANDVLFSNFEWDDGYVYPEDFGGTYIDYDTLHILLTSFEEVHWYEDLLSNYKKIKYDLVEYSYNELYSEAEGIVDNLDFQFVVSYGVDVKTNRGFIGVLEDHYDELLPFENEIVYIIAEEPVIEDIGVRGGALVNVNGPAFTIACGGTYNGNDALLTCGHGMSVNSPVTWYNNTVGIISMVQYNSNQTGDYAFANCTNGYSPSTTYYTNLYGSYSNYTGYYYNPPAGTYLYRYGSSSGQAQHQVVNTGVTAVNNGVTINNLTMATGTAQNGDSGGLYRYGNMFCGVHHGHATVDGVNCVFFTPYVYPNAAGFTILTSTS